MRDLLAIVFGILVGYPIGLAARDPIPADLIPHKLQPHEIANPDCVVSCGGPGKFIYRADGECVCRN